MRIGPAIAIGLAAAGLAACTTGYDEYPTAYYPESGGDVTGWDNYGRYGAYRYGGSDYDTGAVQARAVSLAGTGVERLDPWLALTPEGRDIVLLGFDTDDDGQITVVTADRANVWFRRYADADQDLRLTDPEIRVALVQGSRDRPWTQGGY